MLYTLYTFSMYTLEDAIFAGYEIGHFIAGKSITGYVCILICLSFYFRIY